MGGTVGKEAEKYAKEQFFKTYSSIEERDDTHYGLVRIFERNPSAPKYDPSQSSSSKSPAASRLYNKSKTIAIKESVYQDNEQATKDLTSMKSLISQHEADHSERKTRNIIEIYECFMESEDRLCSSVQRLQLVLEYFQRDLQIEVKTKKLQNQRFSPQDITTIAMSCINALAHLQKANITHGFLRSSQILVSDSGEFKLLHPSILKTTPSFSALIASNHGADSLDSTGIYLSPILTKAVAASSYNPQHNEFKSDVFTLGMILLECCILLPMDGVYDYKTGECREIVLQQHFQTVKSVYGMLVYDILARMLRIHEHERPDFLQLSTQLNVPAQMEQIYAFQSQIDTSKPSQSPSVSLTQQQLQQNATGATLYRVFNTEEGNDQPISVSFGAPVIPPSNPKSKLVSSSSITPPQIPSVNQTTNPTQESTLFTQSNVLFQQQQYNQLQRSMSNTGNQVVPPQLTHSQQHPHQSQPFPQQQQQQFYQTPQQQQIYPPQLQQQQQPQQVQGQRLSQSYYQQNPGAALAAAAANGNVNVNAQQVTPPNLQANPYQYANQQQQQQVNARPLVPPQLHQKQPPIENNDTIKRSAPSLPPTTNSSQTIPPSTVNQSTSGQLGQQIYPPQVNHHPSSTINQLTRSGSSFNLPSEQLPQAQLPQQQYHQTQSNINGSSTNQFYHQMPPQPSYQAGGTMKSKITDDYQVPENVQRIINDFKVKQIQNDLQYQEKERMSQNTMKYSVVARDSPLKRDNSFVVAQQLTGNPQPQQQQQFQQQPPSQGQHAIQNNYNYSFQSMKGINENSLQLQQSAKVPYESDKGGFQSSGQLEYIHETYDDQSQYVGEKLGGLRHGQGKFFYADGGYYMGEWKEGRMEGMGTLYYPSGSLAYHGNWRNDQFNGKGTVYNESPTKIAGEFDFSNFDSLSEFWIKYEGDFVDDNKEGMGSIFLSNGDRFVGSFKNDFVHGKGQYFKETQQPINAIWECNHLVQYI